MNNIYESKRWVKDAQVCLENGEHCFNFNDWAGAVQNCQLCIEFFAKGIISYFSEPDWTHDPSNQLGKVLEKIQDTIPLHMLVVSESGSKQPSVLYWY